MQKNKTFTFNNSSSSENFISLNQNSSIKSYCDVAFQLSISLLTFENMTVSERDKQIMNITTSNYNLFTPSNFFESFKNKQNNNELMKDKHEQTSNTLEKFSIIIATRKTLSETSKDNIMRILNKNRREYEIISIRCEDKDLLKWAVNDRRIDYVTVNLQDKPSSIDKALCSLMKQNNKCFEIAFSPLLLPSDNKNFSNIVRNGKKIMKLVLSQNVPFIFTMEPKEPLHMRTGKQIRFIGGILGVPFNKSRKATFDHQLTILKNNTVKLQENYVFEGVKEVSK